jgi:hypothetical protein
MLNVLLCLVILFYSWLNLGVRSAIARQVKSEVSAGTIVCFSGGREILRKEMVSGPFADEYKFAHEVRIKDETGEHELNFAGGLCIIDRGVTSVPKLAVSDLLSCYSGADEMVVFEVYGRETTVDEYVEGRTFSAKARGNGFDADLLHEYLVFGNEACIGNEISAQK